MGILYWDKPERVLPIEQWRELGFDGGPSGAYVPNMSDEDKLRWKAKLVGHTSGAPRIEIRKSTAGGTQLLIVVSLQPLPRASRTWVQAPEKNIKLSMNGPAELDWADVCDLQQAINEARAVLHAREEGGE